MARDGADRRPLRLLQVSAFFPAHGGGIEAVAGQLATRLAHAGVEVHWIAGGSPQEWPDPGTEQRLRITPIASHDPLEGHLGLPMPLWGPRGLVALWRAVGNADLVHVHDYLYQGTLAAALFARLRRRPLVVTQHIGAIPFRSAFAQRLLTALNRTLGAAVLRGAARVVFVGQPVKAYFESFTRFVREPLLIPNGVDTSVYRPASRDHLVVAPREVSLLFVGRFVEKKGLGLLRRCLDLAGARWDFVGWGPLAPAAQSSPTVQLHGRLPADRIVAHYQRADLLVLPSTGEGFPLVVQEALACGTPVLVSREVAEAFPIRNEACVFDVELRVDDPAAALRGALERLVADRPRLAAAREAAVAIAAQWSWERCVAAYRSVYDRALGGASSDAPSPDR